MKLAITIILIIVLIAVLFKVYLIFNEQKKLKIDLADANIKLESLKKENESLNTEINYLAIPQNLEKELKSKFNYKKPDEKMMIIVPQ